MKIKILENILTTMSLRSLLILINLTLKYLILKYVNIFRIHALWEPLFSQFPVFAVIKIMYGCCCCLLAKSCPTLLRLHGLQPPRLPCPWDFPAKNTGVGCHFVLQGIFPIQGLSTYFLHWQVNSLPLSHQGSPCMGTGSI